MDPNVPEQVGETQNQTLLVWKAPLRPYKKRSVVLLRFFLAIALLISAIVFFFGDLVTILPVWALLFLFYIFAVTPPPIIENHITRFGIETAGITLRWDALSHYYFVERLGYQVLVLVTHGPYFAHSFLVVPDDSIKSSINLILGQHLMFVNNPPATLTDKLIKLFAKLIPEERTEEETKPILPPTIQPTVGSV